MAGLINFEDEEEVKQFLDNLGVEYSFQCYKEKDPEGKTSPLCSHCTDAETPAANSLLALFSFTCHVFFRVPKVGGLLGRGEEKV